MNKNTLKTSLRLMIVLGALVLIAQGVSAEANVDADGVYDDWGKYMGAGIALGLAAVGAGIASLWALVGIYLGKWFERDET